MSKRSLRDVSRRSALRDVAEAAGVSLSTASKALNGRFDVNAETRQRVIDAAAQLEFVPNDIARGLQSGTSRTVGTLTDGSDGGRFTFQVMLGAEEALGEAESSVILCNTNGDPEREKFYIQHLMNRQADAMIVVGDAPHGRDPVAKPAHPSTIYTIAYSRDPADTSYAPDNRQGGRVQANYILAEGRRRVVLVGGNGDWDAARDRVEGATEVLTAAGLELAAPTAYGTWSAPWGWERCNQLLDDGVAMDAVICASDQVAVGVIDAIQQRGRRVPDDIAVIGFDNWAVILESVRCHLPSVDMNMHQLGKTAAQAAIGVRDDGPGVHFLPCTLAGDR